MTNQFYDVLMCFFSFCEASVAGCPSSQCRARTSLRWPDRPAARTAAGERWSLFFFFHLFVSVTTNKESRKQTNEYNMTHLLWARLLREDCAFMFNDKFACLFVFQKDRGFAHACDPALHHKSIVTNWKSGQQWAVEVCLFVCCQLKQMEKLSGAFHWTAQRRAAVFEATFLFPFLVTSTERAKDSVVTQWKVDIRPDIPITSISTNVGSPRSPIFWPWLPWRLPMLAK